MTLFVDIAIETPLLTSFTYVATEEQREFLKRGTRVLVPFRSGQAVGICLKIHEIPPQDISPEKIKKIISVSDKPSLNQATLDWLDFMTDYYAVSPGIVWAQALPSAYFDPKDFYLEKKRRLKFLEIPVSTKENVSLTPLQKKIAEDIFAHFGKFYPALLWGVTGSGKTEVYIDVIRKVLHEKKSALFLIPEIGLTPQTVGRLRNHFGDCLEFFHSGLTDNQRLHVWQKCFENEPRVLVGTRSALFAPFPNLGVIIVDEEHDGSYKQEDRFRYHARDMAVTRARFENIPVILGSATPSLESYARAQAQKYALFHLHERPQGGSLPDVKIIDAIREKEQTSSTLTLSKSLIHELKKTLMAGRQALLFVAQRGFAQNAFCVDCRQIMLCPNCSVGLKVHDRAQQLKCHYCEYEQPLLEKCPSCHEGAITILGTGIQSVEDEFKTMFPGVSYVRVDSDSFPNPAKLEKVLKDFSCGKISVLLGTHMMSKGHDFPGVDLVGVMGLDGLLGFPDFRAQEKAFQLIVQVVGRGGREGQKARALIQTHFPDHPILKQAVMQDFKSFAESELNAREALGYPPATRLVQFRWQSAHENLLRIEMQRIKNTVSRLEKKFSQQGICFLGPVDMPLFKMRGRFRTHLIVKVPMGLRMGDVSRYLIQEFSRGSERRVMMLWDIDPHGFL